MTIPRAAIEKAEKIKCWVVYGGEFPSGLVCEERYWALENSKELRDCGERAYVRVKYYTREQLDAMEEI